MKITKILKEFFNSIIKPKKEISKPYTIDKKTTEFSLTQPSPLSSGISFFYSQVSGYEYNVNEFIELYRRYALYEEVDDAIDEIVNEAIVTNEPEIVKLDLIDIELSESIKNKILDEFDYLLKLLNFNKEAQTLFRDWYVDGRSYFEIVLKNEKVGDGIQKIKYLDSLRIKSLFDEDTKKVIFEYDPNLKNMKYIGNYEKKYVSEDLIVYVGSGFIDKVNYVELSWLHKAIKAINNLRNVEDSIVITRFTRSVERRVFNIDVGNLPKSKAEEHLIQAKNKFRNRISYNSETGEINSENKAMAVVEDFWFAKKADGRGSEVSLLQEGKNLGELEDLHYFISKLWRALNIPESRRNLTGEKSMIDLSSQQEMERDELKFMKFIEKLQLNFSKLFIELLKRQLIYKKVMRESQFDDIKDNLKFKWAVQNNYKETEKMASIRARFEVLSMIEEYVNKWITEDQVALEVLNYTEDEWEGIKKEIEKKKKELEKLEKNGDKKEDDKNEDNIDNKEDQEDEVDE